VDGSGVESGAATDVGAHRDHNEDAFLVSERVFAVADGMGGHQAGEVASSLAVEVLAAFAEQPVLSSDQVQDIVGAAHDRIAERGHQVRTMAGMGTTLAGLAEVSVAGQPHWAVFNVGDSRVYRYAGGLLTQISVDHSEVEELVASGVIDREQARTDFRRNIITRSLGADARPQADLWVFPQAAGDQFLICSDGLTNELSDDQIATLLASTDAPEQVARRLVDAAVAAGGHDNVTAVVVRVPFTPDDNGEAMSTGPLASEDSTAATAAADTEEQA
jgi:protein phosphatase